MSSQSEYDDGYDDGLDDEPFNRDEKQASDGSFYAQGYNAGQCERHNPE